MVPLLRTFPLGLREPESNRWSFLRLQRGTPCPEASLHLKMTKSTARGRRDRKHGDRGRLRRELEGSRMAIPVDGSASRPSSPDLTALLGAIRGRHCAQLADILDTLELEIAASGASKPEDWPYAVHVLAHVVNHDLNSARFVWKRTPAAVKESSPELVAAWKIVQHMWTHDHAGVYKSLKGFNWTELVQPVAGAIGDEYSTSMLRLLSIAYSTVSVADASGFLGFPENETVTFLTQEHGWVLDPASQMLTVRPMSSVANKKTDSSQLQNLTEYVFHLEH